MKRFLVLMFTVINHFSCIQSEPRWIYQKDESTNPVSQLAVVSVTDDSAQMTFMIRKRKGALDIFLNFNKQVIPGYILVAFGERKNYIGVPVSHTPGLKKTSLTIDSDTRELLGSITKVDKFRVRIDFCDKSTVEFIIPTDSHLKTFLVG
jgi:hypothetical protein